METITMSSASGVVFRSPDSALPAVAYALSFERSLRAGKIAVTLPFDALRAQYAGAVVAGWLPRSLIASGRFERALGLVECATLGPLARRV
jgi:hypothetical protein